MLGSVVRLARLMAGPSAGRWVHTMVVQMAPQWVDQMVGQWVDQTVDH